MSNLWGNLKKSHEGNSLEAMLDPKAGAEWGWVRPQLEKMTGAAASEAEVSAYIQRLQEQAAQGDGADSGPESYPAMEPEPPKQDGKTRRFSGDWIRNPDGTLTFAQTNVRWE